MMIVKRLIIGIVIGLVFGLTTNAFAAVGDKIEAMFTEFNFVVNGEDKELDTLPIVINGTSYLPVRAVSNMLGYDVTYKADSRTIELTIPETVSKTVSEGVSELQSIKEITVQEQIKELEKQIARKKVSIQVLMGGLRPGDEENQQAYNKEVEELAQLEAQKTELEAQQTLQE
jgi:hypothetical protein